MRVPCQSLRYIILINANLSAILVGVLHNLADRDKQLQASSIQRHGGASDLEVIEVLETQPTARNVQPVELGEGLPKSQPRELIIFPRSCMSDSRIKGM